MKTEKSQIAMNNDKVYRHLLILLKIISFSFYVLENKTAETMSWIPIFSMIAKKIPEKFTRVSITDRLGSALWSIIALMLSLTGQNSWYGKSSESLYAVILRLNVWLFDLSLALHCSGGLKHVNSR
jgi:hypothetical protein